jgi:transposase-like protein
MTTEVERKCPECGSDKLIKVGYVWSGRRKVQQYRCTVCGRTTVNPVEPVKTA